MIELVEIEIPLLLVAMEIRVLDVAEPTENSAEMLVIAVELSMMIVERFDNQRNLIK